MKILGFNINRVKKNEVKATDLLAGFTPVQKLIFLEQMGRVTGTNVYRKLWVAAKCVNLIAENFASLPYYVEDNKGNKLENEVLFDKFMNNPNPDQNGVELMRAFCIYVLLNGNGYIWENFGGLDSDFWVLQSHHMQIIGNKEIIEQVVQYRYNENGKTKIYQPDELLVMKTFNPDSRIVGLPKLTAASKEVDYLKLADNYKNSLFKNQASPSGIFTTDDILTDEERNILRQTLKESHTGVFNAGSPLVFEKGLKYQALSFNPADLNLIQSEIYTESAIATLYGVPTELLGHLAEKKNRANYREARHSFYIETILPFAEDFIRMLNNRFYPEGEKRIEIEKSEIPELRPTNEELEKQYWTSPNYKRAIQGQRRDEDPNMDKKYFPNNLVPLEDLNNMEDRENL